MAAKLTFHLVRHFFSLPAGVYFLRQHRLKSSICARPSAHHRSDRFARAVGEWCSLSILPRSKGVSTLGHRQLKGGGRVQKLVLQQGFHILSSFTLLHQLQI